MFVFCLFYVSTGLQRKNKFIDLISDNILPTQFIKKVCAVAKCTQNIISKKVCRMAVHYIFTI